MIVPQQHASGVQDFATGEHIRHRIYGYGTVIDADRYTRADMVRVRFEKAGILRVIRSSVWTSM